MFDRARVEKARAEWPWGIADFNAILAAREEEEERRQFFLDNPTKEMRTRAVAARIRAELSGRD